MGGSSGDGWDELDSIENLIGSRQRRPAVRLPTLGMSSEGATDGTTSSVEAERIYSSVARGTMTCTAKGATTCSTGTQGTTTSKADTAMTWFEARQGTTASWQTAEMTPSTRERSRQNHLLLLAPWSDSELGRQNGIRVGQRHAHRHRGTLGKYPTTTPSPATPPTTGSTATKATTTSTGVEATTTSTAASATTT